MKRKIITLILVCLQWAAWSQPDSNVDLLDSVKGVSIVDYFMSRVDFQQEKTDSILFVKTSVVERNHTDDTMTIYRWYMAPMSTRIELWQDGKMADAYYSDGRSIFRHFDATRREWVDMDQMEFTNFAEPLDIRGALYNWRSKGAEISYAGEYTMKGQAVDRVYVTCPHSYDRYYFFEKNSGMLFMVTESDRRYGNAKSKVFSVNVDWRAWSEYVPVHQFMMPAVESYQVQDQVIIIKNKYQYLPKQTSLFSEDFIPKR